MVFKFYFSTLLFFIFCTLSFGQILGNIESVEYDPGNNQWFVSNNVNIVSIDNNGTESVWGSGSAAYGMEVVGNRLFVINNGRINVYDTMSKEEIANVPVPGAGFLNGMTSNGSDLIWVTDFSNNKILQIDFSDFNNPIITDLGNTIVKPNGIVHEASSNSLFFVAWSTSGQILKLDLNNNPLLPPMIAATGTGLSDMDGIDQDSDGNFYVSSWSPTRITKFSNDFLVSEIIETGTLNRPADICFSVERNTLAIPNSGNSQVTFVSFGTTETKEIVSNEFAFNILPNPMRHQGSINFTTTTKTQLTIFSRDGRMVFENTFNTGEHQINVQNIGIKKGFYYCVLNDGMNVERKGFMVK